MRVLKSSGDPIRPVKKQPSSSDDADFLQRWMKSDDYKRSTGGRAMLSTDYGIETLPEYERIGFAADDLRYVDAIEGRPDLGGVSRPTPEASFIDLRQPVRSTEVMSEYPQIATHELSHTTGEPVTLTNELGLVDRSTKVDSRFLPSDRLPVRYISYLNPETGEIIEEPEYVFESGKGFENVRPEIADVLLGKHRLDFEYSPKKPGEVQTFYDYLNQPTEISARLRNITKSMQDAGLKDKNDYEKGYTLTFDDVLYANDEMGDTQAFDLLVAIGLYKYDKQYGEWLYDEDREAEARELFNTYISGKL